MARAFTINADGERVFSNCSFAFAPKSIAADSWWVDDMLQRDRETFMQRAADELARMRNGKSVDRVGRDVVSL